MNPILGHDKNFEKVSFGLSKATLHHGIILAGPKGVGKASFAKAIAAMIVDPDKANQALIASGNHPDIITISRPPKEPPKPGEAVAEDAELKRSIGVDQIRRLQSVLTKRPTVAETRVVIIDAADDMESSASNALLKSLEEPPVGCHFLLISHASDRLLPTIRSRCQMLRFEPLKSDLMIQVLQELLPGHEASEIALLANLGCGAPGAAMEFAGLNIGELEDSMQKIVEGGDSDNAIRSALASKLALKAAQPRYEAFLRRAPALIANQARQQPAEQNLAAVDAFQRATQLASRATGLSLDKNAVILEMGSLLAGLNQHKHTSR